MPSFLQEYSYKLKVLYDNFYTLKGKMIAMQRQAIAVNFYESILNEITATHFEDMDKLSKILE